MHARRIDPLDLICGSVEMSHISSVIIGVVRLPGRYIGTLRLHGVLWTSNGLRTESPPLISPLPQWEKNTP